MRLGGRALVTLVPLLVLLAGPASAAPPGTAFFRPNDPGYQSSRETLDSIDAPAFWAAVSRRPCTAGTAVIDAGPVSVADMGMSMVANFAPGGGDPSHGLYVSSIIGAGFDNGIGIAGLAAGCPVPFVRVLGPDPDGSGSMVWRPTWLAPAISYAAGVPGVRVINLSLWQTAGTSVWPPVAAAVRDAEARGILVVVIAGNGVDNDCRGSADPSANPLAAAFALDNGVLRVAGSTPGGQLAACSNYGPLADIAEPYEMPVDTPSGDWAIHGGTSFSAPVAAAIAARMFSLDPRLTPADVKTTLMRTCSRAGIAVGCGGIGNAYAALAATPGFEPAPAVTLTVSKRGSGAVSDQLGYVQCPEACSATLLPGTRVALTAEADDGFVFRGWGGACSGSSSTCSVVVASGTAVSATFSRATARLTVRKVGKGTVSTPAGIACGTRCVAPVQVGRAVKLAAHPARGWRFVRWSGACKGTRPTCTLKVTAAATVTAFFARVA